MVVIELPWSAAKHQDHSPFLARGVPTARSEEALAREGRASAILDLTDAFAPRGEDAP
jgi:hypothetical protein